MTSESPPRQQTLASRPPNRRPFALVMAVLAAGLVLAVLLAARSGFIALGLADVARIIAAKVLSRSDWIAGIDPLLPVVVMDVRLPRIVASVLVGGGLAAAGVVFQGILLNPLADPYTLGVSAGAAFGACLALLFKLSLAGIWSVPVCAFIGAAATLAAVIGLSRSAGAFSSGNLILSGIIVAAILSAGISLLKYIADEQVAVIIFWLMGSFAAKTWTDVTVVLALVAAGMVVFIFYARDLNLIALGERSAASLGVDTQQVTLVLLVAASLVTAGAVAISGIIGFVGLLVPHMLRAAVGPDNRRLLPAALVAGGLLLLAADTLTRTVLPVEVPIGVVTALIGGPFFCYIFRKRMVET